MRYAIVFSLGVLAQGTMEMVMEMTPGAGGVTGIFHVTSAMILAVGVVLLVRVGQEAAGIPSRPTAREEAAMVREEADAVIRREGGEPTPRGWREHTCGDTVIVPSVVDVGPTE